MHIVILCDHAHINGGQAKVAIDSAKGLAARGHSIDYFAAVGPIEPGLSETGVTVTLLDQPDVRSTESLLRFGLQWLWNVPAARGLAALLSRSSPEETIIHVHGWSKALSPSIGRILQNAGFAVVFTLHEYFLACPNGGFYDHRAASTCTYRPMSLSCTAHHCDSHGYHRKLMRAGRHALMRLGSGLYESARHVITISKLQRKVISPYLRQDATYYEVGNPIDVAPLGPKENGPLGDFLFVGRIDPEKGPRYFAEAARLARVKAVFAGDGRQTEELRRDFPQAKFLGWQRPEAVRSLLRKARALVFPSVWLEGQPLVIYEALASGTPVIVSDQCAGREAVSEGRNGLLFKSADVQALAAALARLSNDATAHAMARDAYDLYWADPLTLGRHLDAIEGVYQRVLDAHARP